MKISAGLTYEKQIKDNVKMLRFGIICDLDISKGMARVKFDDDDITSHWLPISVPNSKENKFSLPFDINEHVWCMMDENAEFGVIGGAIYSDTDIPPDGASEGKVMVRLAANLLLQYDRESQSLTLENEGEIHIKTSGNVNIECEKATVTAKTSAEVIAPAIKLTGNVVVSGTLSAASIATTGGGNITSAGNMNVQGSMTIAGDATISGKSFSTHKHTSAASGSPTSQPI